jgi:hypothetical protein
MTAQSAASRRFSLWMRPRTSASGHSYTTGALGTARTQADLSSKSAGSTPVRPRGRCSNDVP